MVEGAKNSESKVAVMKLINVQNEYMVRVNKCAKCGKSKSIDSEHWCFDIEDKPWTCYCESCSRKLVFAAAAHEIGMVQAEYSAFVNYLETMILITDLPDKLIWGRLHELIGEVNARATQTRDEFETRVKIAEIIQKAPNSGGLMSHNSYTESFWTVPGLGWEKEVRVELQGNTQEGRAVNLVDAIKLKVKDRGMIEALRTYGHRLITAVYPFAFEYALSEYARNRGDLEWSDKDPSLLYSLYRRFLESYRNDDSFRKQFHDPDIDR